MDDDFLHELMENAGRELRDIRVPLHNGEKTINIRRFAFLQLHFFPKGTRQHLELLFFLLIVRREFLKAFIGELARNVVLIEPLEDSIQLCDPLLGIDKLPFPLCKIACGLNNLQLIRAGEPLGGKASAESDFATDDDDDFLS